MKHPNMYPFFAIIMIAALLLSACGPMDTGSSAPVSTNQDSQQLPTPTTPAEVTTSNGIQLVPTATTAAQNVPIPPQLYERYPEADPEYQATYTAISECVPDLNKGGKFNTPTAMLFPCADSDLYAQLGTVTVVSLATAYTLMSSQIASGSLVVVGVVTEVISGVVYVVGAVLASPVTIAVAVVALVGISLYSLIFEPQTIENQDVYNDFLNNHYASEMEMRMIANGTLAFDFTSGQFVASQPVMTEDGSIVAATDIQVSMAAIDTRAFVKRYGYENLFARLVTFTIIAKDPVQRSELMVMLASRGATIVGVYESCEQWQSVGSPFAGVFVIGKHMDSCAITVHNTHPLAFKIYLHSSLYIPSNEVRSLASEKFFLVENINTKRPFLEVLKIIADSFK